MKLNILFFALLCFVLSCTSKPKDSTAEEASEKTDLQVTEEASNVEASKPSEAVPLSELIANKEKYEGHAVTVKGKCVKVNNNIMNKNWIHLQDGSLQNDMDLTVTTTENIQVDEVVTLQGTIALNKDFGEGYKYEIIMEDARLVK